METERWHEVDRLFDEALDRPPADRPAFLEAACAGDTALRRDVERLLAADDEGSGFLANPPDELLRLTLDDREDGGSLGPYRLLRKIGSGGMGTVYLARREDEHYQRDVAVKILRSGLESTEIRHRFVAERQILANLDHPNIARLYDGGSTVDGRPYLVMELVEGLPVDEYCDNHRLTIDQRLELFLKICAAVQHAHQNLLVHRDLKPANILVTPEGEPKLLDFGIAKRLAPQAGEHPPENAHRAAAPDPALRQPRAGPGRCDHDGERRLLSRRDPLRAAGGPQPLPARRRSAARDRPRHLRAGAGTPQRRPVPDGHAERGSDRRGRCPGPPVEASSLAHRLRGDLDNIVLMALRKEPRRRYGSAAQLAQDLEKHLKDLPVTARPDTLSYRTRKFARRHRTGLAATAGRGPAPGGLRGEPGRAGTAGCPGAGQGTLRAVVPGGHLQAGRSLSDPGRESSRPARSSTRERPASRGSLREQPDVQAAVMDAIGEANLGLGRFAEAEPLLTRALAQRRQLFGPDSLEVAESLEHLAALQSRRSSLESAEASLREALAIRRRHQGDGDLAVARTLHQLGELLVQQGATPEDTPEIEALFREALAIARRVEGPEGATVAEILINRGLFQLEQGDYAAAERLLREGLAVERKALGDRDPRLYRDQANLGIVLVMAGKHQEAEALLLGSLDAQQKILGREHPDVAETINNLAAALHYGGRCGEAEALSREELAKVRSYYGPAHWRVANSLHALGATIACQGRFPEAIDLYNQSLEIRRQAGKEDTLFGRTLLVLAESYRNQKNYSQALEAGHQALENFEKTRGPEHTDVAWPLYEIGRSYQELERFAEAEPYLRRSLDIRLRRLEPDHVEVAKVQYVLAKCLVRLGRSGEAKPLLQKSRTTMVAVNGPDHETVQRVDRLLAEAASEAAGTRAD